MLEAGVFEKVIPDSGSSFKLLTFSENELCSNPHWHFHPEYEIAYISNGVGRRQVGNHASVFSDGDLIAIGPFVPHYRFGTGGSEPYTTVAVQISQSFMNQDIFNIPELRAIHKFKKISPYGVSYSNEIKEEVGQILLKMTKSVGFQRFQMLLTVLSILSNTDSYQLLNTTAASCTVGDRESQRIKKVYQTIETNYRNQISIEQVAEELSLSVTYTCRFLKEKLFKTFSEILNEYRVSVASELLLETNKNVIEICYEVGYNNISHFNRRFKSITGVSPKEYRKLYINTKVVAPLLD
ncbi:MAG: AraC family transcriptional regulator [Reichenbachiella sp.]|uniref:AraC family transcriptional regulator n=1 Tax=Reichenbachiella sp. TaxID=2184521 RepID=UPI00326725C0